MDDNEIDSIQIGSMTVKPISSTEPQRKPLHENMSEELKQSLLKKTCETDKDRFTRLFAIIERSRYIHSNAQLENPTPSFILALELNISEIPQWDLFFMYYPLPKTFEEFASLDIPTMPELVKKIYTILQLVLNEQNPTSFKKKPTPPQDLTTLLDSNEYPFRIENVDIKRLDCVIVYVTFGIIVRKADIIFVYKDFTPSFSLNTLKQYWQYPIRW